MSTATTTEPILAPMRKEKRIVVAEEKFDRLTVKTVTRELDKRGRHVLSRPTTLAERKGTIMSETEIATRSSQDGELSIQQLAGNMEKLRDVMRSVMVADVDYGQVPGTKSKPTLLKPGGEKLAMMFRFSPTFEETITKHQGDHREYEVKCRLIHLPTGLCAGEASAVCSTLEAKYRYRGGARKCPMCGKECIKKSKYPPRNNPHAKPGFYCFAKVGGCGAEFDANDKDIISQSETKTENHDIADQWNTVKQIAQKRAFLSAIKTATASSELFTIDVGDPENEHDHSAPPDADSVKNQRRQQASGEESQAPPEKPKEHDEWRWMRDSLKAFGCTSYKNDKPAIDALLRYAVANATWQNCYDSAAICRSVLDRWQELQGGDQHKTLDQMKKEALELATANPTPETEEVPF